MHAASLLERRQKPRACVYDGRLVYRIAAERLVARCWIPAVDTVEAYEFVADHFVGVWFGNRTPYLWTSTPDLCEIIN